MFIKIENLTKRFGQENLFSGINLMITDSHRVGLVGKNGVGKTTFLKILANELKADRGSFQIDPKNAKLVYHTQVLDENSKSQIPNSKKQTTFTYLLSQNREIFEIWSKLNSGDGTLDYSELVSEYTEKGGYDFEDRIFQALKRLKLDPEQEVQTLSGGQKTRLQFGKLLIEDHNVLLLDEPTNHLDIDGIEWFYEYIENYKGIIIIATHDRNLLSKSINKIIEFEDKKVVEYSGNYEFYKQKKRESRVAAESRIRSNEKRVEQLNEAAKKLQERVDRHEKRAQEIDFKNRMVRLDKKTKHAKTKIIQKKLALYRDNDKLTANFKLDRQAVKLKAARSNLLTKADRVDRTRKKIGWDMKIDFNTPEIQSDFVLRIKDFSKSFGEKEVVNDFNLHVMKNEKIAIVGPNGTGKSTILRSIAGDINDYTGEIYIADSVKIGYLEQENTSLNYQKTVLNEFLSGISERLTDTEARSFLHFFLFEGDMPLRKVETLSEGEKLKLKLAKLLFSKNNLLLLDEPTNHLDIASQEVIEKALKDFDGSMILVTHDEALIKGLGINKIINLS